MRNFPFRISLIYFLIASLWIFLSDSFTAQIVPAESITTAQTIKGFAFVFVSASILFVLLRYYYRQVQKNEREYRRLFNESPYPLYVFDTKTLKFLTVNDAAVEKYKYSYQEFRNMSMLDIRPPEDRNSIVMFLKKIESKQYHESGIWRHMDRDGKIFYVRIASHSTTFGKHDARVVQAIDIDEQMQVEKKLKDVAWIQSHEVRKPLANIMGLMELIKAEKDPEQLRMVIVHMEESCQELDTIIRKIVKTSFTENQSST